MRKFQFTRKRLETFAKRWQVVELGLFGSVLREDFHHASDIDELVSFSPDAHHSLFDLARMEEE